MASLLSEKFTPNRPSINQSTGAPGSQAIASIDNLLLILPHKVSAALWRTVPQGAKVQALLRRGSSDSVPAIVTRVNNKRQTGLFVGRLDAATDAFEQLTFARKMIAAAVTEKPGTLGVWVLGFDADDQQTIVTHVTAAVLAAGFSMPDFKSKPAPAKIKRVRLLGLVRNVDLGRVQAEANGNNLARFLTALPPNKLDAAEYVSLLRELARNNGWQFKKYGLKELQNLGAGAFLAVAQGNADDSAAIVRLRYRPAGKTDNPALSLVGKGIIFDTGGTNLKPFLSMLDMHIDMGGSAVAVGTLQTITDLKLEQSVDCWLAITENRTGPTAYKSQDVVTAANGKTIQTIHTDAEGRMALADALVLACRDKPGLIIDYATLTGACINATTTRFSGVFTNKPDWHPVLKKAGRASGERVWPFPLGKEFLEDLKSETADIKQCAPNGGGDHILAASFLNEFVDGDIPWVHVDLSACSRKGGLGHVPSELTGFGVRYSMNLILDQKALESVKRKKA